MNPYLTIVVMVLAVAAARAFVRRLKAAKRARRDRFNDLLELAREQGRLEQKWKQQGQHSQPSVLMPDPDLERLLIEEEMINNKHKIDELRLELALPR